MNKRKNARHCAVAALACASASFQASSQSAPEPQPQILDPVVVTATRTKRPISELPASIGEIGSDRIQNGQMRVNLSETLNSIAGVVANNRQNYAQDLQVSIRGFGARSTFGVRGVRVIVDGIPATMPDGQAQISHVALSSANRIEVMRGPFSALYGNSSGGVIQVFSEEGVPGAEIVPSLTVGSLRTLRAGLKVDGTSGSLNYLVDAGHFETRGFRDHSEARRDTANAKSHIDLSPATRITLIANGVAMPQTQDPMGLTRSQFQSDPRSVDASALQFNTRKSVDQRQGGIVLEHAMGDGDLVRMSAYYGQRGTRQYQAIPVATQLNALHPGGVIDLRRQYDGLDARWTWRGSLLDGPLSIVAGFNVDRLHEDRRGYENFSGPALGVLGALRRSETNVVDDVDQYLQGEWQLAPSWNLLAGLRASRIHLVSADHYVTTRNPDDSGRSDFKAVTPVAGMTFRAAPGLHVYASAGKGFETPTLNEVAYRANGLTGLNLDLRPAKSENYEIGAKILGADAWRVTGAIFHVSTRDELVVLTNAGGRSTFQNAGSTRRDGAEIELDKSWNTGIGFSAALSALRARYADSFLTCTTAPCNTPATQVSAGSRIPGIPSRVGYAELRWRESRGMELAIEAHYSDRLYVNDVNSDSAPAYTVASARVTYTWRKGNLAVRPFLRIDNLFDRRYVGSVIVNEGNGRYFEPSPGRFFLAGIKLTGAF